MTTILTPKVRAVTIRQEGDKVLLLEGGKLLLELPWQAAQELGRALLYQANKAEENAKAEQVIFDQAILIRAGVPIGLTSDPAKQDEAGKEAAWNSVLRRAMPGGVKSQEAFGTPAIIKHRKRGNNV